LENSLVSEAPPRNPLGVLHGPLVGVDGAVNFLLKNLISSDLKLQISVRRIFGTEMFMTYYKKWPNLTH